ncbi:MAG: hypothetical protein EBT07_17885 [Actinobacteria bacterium]|nr:hypothetical protein [Actinomycetota bacterium]
MRFSVNPSRDVSLRNDMVARELTGTGYEPVPEEIRRIAPIEKAREYAKQMPEMAKAEPTLDFIEEQQPMQTKTEQDVLQSAALKTIDFEARKDKQGNVQVYKLPAGDMGGNFEVAGINDKYHPDAFKRISSLPAQERAQAAAQYVKEYTSPFVSKLPEAVQPFAQDLAFNRGMGGATKYIQQGLNTLGQKVAVDGGLGPKTLQAINQVDPKALMRAASQAQLEDEYRMAQRNPARKKFIGGLESRIRNRLAIFGA